MAATALPLFPFETWPDNIEEADVVANDNARRAEVVGLPALSFEATQPGSPADGDLYVLSAAWGDEVEGTLAYYFDGAWTYWVPVEGQTKEINGISYRFDGADWVTYTPGAAASIAIQYLADTSSTADSDPGPGLLRWNNASQSAATILFLDDLTDDGGDLTPLWAALEAGGFMYLQHATNQDIWQIREITAVTDATGYAKLTAAYLSGEGSFSNTDPMLVTIEQGANASDIATIYAILAAAGIGEQYGVVLTDLNVTITTEPMLFSFGSSTTNAPFTNPGAGVHIPVSATAAIQIVQAAGNNVKTYVRSASSSAYNAWTELGFRVPRIATNTSGAITPNWENVELIERTAQAAGLTINDASTHASDGGMVGFRLRDDGTARALTWNAAYVGNNLPGTTVPGKTLSVWFRRNATQGTYELQYFSDSAPRNLVSALATSGSVAIDASLGDYFTLALAGNVTTFTFSNLPGSGKAITLMIRITQDSTPRTVGWPASFKWAGGVAGAVSTASGAVDVLAITSFDNGTSWQASLGKAYA